MRAMFAAAACLAVAASPIAGALAQPAAGGDIASKIVNDPGAPEVQGAKASLRDDPVVQGGKALRIEVPRKGANTWDSTVGGAIKKPVKAGDTLLLAFYARLERGENGATKTVLPFAGVQLVDAPWTPLFQEPVEIGPEWKLLKVKGKVDKSYAAGKLKVTVQLATAKQAVDIGPLIVLNQGPE
ncbi:MAG TPA: hypothetical protein VGC56_08795 [Allosphingosinicella sp.]